MGPARRQCARLVRVERAESAAVGDTEGGRAARGVIEQQRGAQGRDMGPARGKDTCAKTCAGHQGSAGDGGEGAGSGDGVVEEEVAHRQHVGPESGHRTADGVVGEQRGIADAQMEDAGLAAVGVVENGPVGCRSNLRKATQAVNIHLARPCLGKDSIGQRAGSKRKPCRVVEEDQVGHNLSSVQS